MKKFALLALAILLVPNIVAAQCTPNGTYLVWYGEPYELPQGENIPIFPGQTLTWDSYVSGEPGCIVICHDAVAGEDCGFLVVDGESWTYGEDAGVCAALPEDGCWIFYFSVTCPPEATIGTVNEALVITCYCNDVSGELDIACATDTMIAYFEVVEPPPEIEIFCNESIEVDQGVTSAYIPFQFCNADLLADPRDYDWWATSQGTVGPAINQSGTLLAVPGGECDWAYAIIDASAANIDDVDTVTMLGFWNAPGPGGMYDTCVQAILIVEAVPVPLFTRPVVTIMVLAMILAAAVVMRRRATSVA
jgi:hypothetical protein